jgi:hypothetical protein
MNNKLDPRVRFEPEPILREAIVQPVRRTWLPALIPNEAAIAPSYWLTRAARGYSWHRSGRVAVRERCQ